jgi:hypothetical protein
MPYESAVKSAFESGTTLTVVLLTLLQKQFGQDVYFWDPTTVFLEIKDEWGAEAATPVMDRISAGQIIVSTDQFFQDISAFLNICNTLSSGQPSFSVFDPVEPEEVAWALTEISLMRELRPFAPTIRDYIRTILEADGYTEENYPDIFEYVLKRRVPKAKGFKDELERSLHDDQTDNVEMYVMDRLQDVLYQFDKIPGMADSLEELLRTKDLEDLGKLEV